MAKYSKPKIVRSPVRHSCWRNIKSGQIPIRETNERDFVYLGSNNPVDIMLYEFGWFKSVIKHIANQRLKVQANLRQQRLELAHMLERDEAEEQMERMVVEDFWGEEFVLIGHQYFKIES